MKQLPTFCICISSSFCTDGQLTKMLFKLYYTVYKTKYFT